LNPNDPNVALVEMVAKALGDLNDTMVFVGGCATGLLITDLARPPVRATQDVDLVVEITSTAEYYTLGDKLRNAGFREEGGEVICRWQYRDLKIDVMPTDESILGFSNRWYPQVLKKANRADLPSGGRIRLISPPLLVATKLEAFYGRGRADYGKSHDIEDIINLVDGRPELVEEVAAEDGELREYLREEVDGLLADSSFVESISWHIHPADEHEVRTSTVIQRLMKIAGL
jgi:predicted nucleotidyltransferase